MYPKQRLVYLRGRRDIAKDQIARYGTLAQGTEEMEDREEQRREEVK